MVAYLKKYFGNYLEVPKCSYNFTLSNLIVKYNSQFMKLTQKALDLIKSKPVDRLDIAKALRVSDQTLMRYINNNDDELTKAAALVEIRRITGMRDEEILVKEVATA